MRRKDWSFVCIANMELYFLAGNSCGMIGRDIIQRSCQGQWVELLIVRPIDLAVISQFTGKFCRGRLTRFWSKVISAFLGTS